MFISSKTDSGKKLRTTTDGGKSYTYDDDVAGAGLKNELNNPDGAIHKNVDANINKEMTVQVLLKI